MYEPREEQVAVEASNPSDSKYRLGCRAEFAAAVWGVPPLSDQHRMYLS